MFNIHDPIGTKRLFQLRVGLSPLKEHKKRHNFKDTPSDLCQCQTQTESTDHFLLKCDLYIDERHDLFEVVNPIIENSNLQMTNNNQLVNLLLYGHAKLCERDNIIVISATLTFIQSTGRFDSV